MISLLQKRIKEITYSKILDEVTAIALASIKEVTMERIDLPRFTREVKEYLPYEVRVSIIEKQKMKKLNYYD